METDNSEQIEAACVEMTALLINSWIRTDQDSEFRPLAISQELYNAAQKTHA
jgi:hypothetical protein